ncbi:MAG: hypothetical protein ACREB0_07735 [Sphingopyxis sp.]
MGLAFLPTQSGAGPTAAQRDELLERIHQRFADRKFVTEIVTNPSKPTCARAKPTSASRSAKAADVPAVAGASGR